jgi:hypothetical protein
LFEKKYLSARWDKFRCFDRILGIGEETENLGGAGAAVKTYRATDERNGPLLEGTPENRPIRKPDPDLRTLRRQISFGSTTVGFGSLRKKPTSTEHETGLLSPPPVVAEESESIAAADAISAEDLPLDRVRLAAKGQADILPVITYKSLNDDTTSRNTLKRLTILTKFEPSSSQEL